MRFKPSKRGANGRTPTSDFDPADLICREILGEDIGIA